MWLNDIAVTAASILFLGFLACVIFGWYMIVCSAMVMTFTVFMSYIVWLKIIEYFKSIFRGEV